VSSAVLLNSAQRDAVEHPGGPLLVLAGAGSGKTRVLTERVARLLEAGLAPQSLLAFTFTNRAAREMRERIARRVGEAARTLWVGTFHGTGLRILRREGAAGRHTRGRDFVVYDHEDQESLLAEALRAMGLVEEAAKPGEILGKISDAKSALVPPAEFERLAMTPFQRRVAEAYARYEEGLRARAAFDFDDLIAKVVWLFREHPEVAEGYARRFVHVLVDEYQDTNHAQFRLVETLSRGHGNVFVVGDDDQCLVEGTAVTMADGSQKAIEKVKAGDLVRSGHGSGDFRAARVLRTHSRRGSLEGVEIITRSGRRIVSTPEHTHFAGYLHRVSPQTFFTYLMYRRGVGYRVGTTQVYTRGQKEPVLGFRLRLAHERGDALWIVGAFESQEEARLEEALLSLRYQMPTVPFLPRRSAGAKGASGRGIVDDPAAIARIFSEFGREDAARELLEDRGLSISYPHYRPRSRDSNRRNVVLTLCGDRRGARPMHRISMVGNDAEGRAILEESGFSVRSAKHNSESWRHETARGSYAALKTSVDLLATKFDLNVHRMARLGKSGRGKPTNSLPFIPAGSVLPGMAMFDECGGFDIVVSVKRVAIEGAVYDLDIENTHNYVANGLVTHNSIYGWRGADITNIIDFENAFPGAAVIRLEQNYRSTGNILAAANAVIANNRERKGKRLWCEGESGPRLRFVLAQDQTDEARRVVQFIGDRALKPGATLKLGDCAVLYRTHAQSRALETELRHRGIAYELVGGISFYQLREVKDLLAYLRLAVNPTDAAAFWRALNTPKRGLGDAVRARIEARLEAGAANPIEALRAALQEGALARGAGSASALLALLDELRSRVAEPGDVLIRLVIERTGYLARLETDDERESAERRANVEELVEAAAAFAAGSAETGVAAYLAEAALLTDADRIEEGVDRVLLLTAHNAKGLEFDAVAIAGLEEGLFPHASALDDPKELEEERRLFYVALTRARRDVHLSAAAFRHRFTANGYSAAGGQVSRFVDEIPTEVLERDEPTIGADEKALPESWRPSRASRGAARTDRVREPWSAPFVQKTHRAVGREVHHESFGRGVVIAAEGQGDSLKFTVRFGTRIKKVLGRFLTEGSHVE
jgi:DNA helicase-2/ATP-dependent DNA helicase PcrA